jgi:hypothetical protein
LKEFPLEKLIKVLTDLGFSQVKGNGSGHVTLQDRIGRTCHPVFRKRGVNFASIYSLGLELESKGVILRKSFVNLVNNIKRRK